MNEDLKREIILDNYQNPCNKCTINDPSFIKVNTKSDSCIDNINLFVKIEDNIIKDMYFDGEACAITTSASSIMIRNLIGKDLDYVENVINNYNNMILNKEYDKELLGELNVYDETYKQSNRIKCALFPFDTLSKAIKEYKEGK